MTNILLGLLDETSARRDELGGSIAGALPAHVPPLPFQSRGSRMALAVVMAAVASAALSRAGAG